MADRDIQKIKIVGILWTTRNLVALLRDICIVIFMIVAIGVLIYAASSLSGVLEGVGGISGLGSTIGALQSGGPQAVVMQLQQDINNGDWNAAEQKLGSLEFIVQQTGDTQAMNDFQQLKQAISQKDTIKANKMLSEASGNSINRN